MDRSSQTAFVPQSRADFQIPEATGAGLGRAKACRTPQLHQRKGVAAHRLSYLSDDPIQDCGVIAAAINL